MQGENSSITVDVQIVDKLKERKVDKGQIFSNSELFIGHKSRKLLRYFINALPTICGVKPYGGTEVLSESGFHKWPENGHQPCVDCLFFVCRHVLIFPKFKLMLF